MIYLYTSSVSGRTQIRKDMARITMILDGRKVPYETLDVSTDEAAKTKLKDNREDKTQGINLPQIWKDDTYLGGFSELDDANEEGELHAFLKV